MQLRDIWSGKTPGGIQKSFRNSPKNSEDQILLTVAHGLGGVDKPANMPTPLL